MCDTYTRLRELGRGAFGTVYLCEKNHNKMKIVIKEITVDDSKDRLNDALNEISILRYISHPNICAYYDSFKRGNTFFIVMEYASYGTLHDYLERRREGRELVPRNVHIFVENGDTLHQWFGADYFQNSMQGIPFLMFVQKMSRVYKRKVGSREYADYTPEALEKCLAAHALNIFGQILLGLNHLHSKNIVHRDLKTENVFLTGSTRCYIKIGDFGISKILKSERGKTDTVIGSTNYFAPEMCDGKLYGTKSDIWSLGCVLYEICACERLFQGSISDVVMAIKSGERKVINTQQFGVDIQEVIDATVEIDPERRPTTANLMAYPVLVPRLCIIRVNLGNIFHPYPFVEKGIETPPAHLLNI